MRKNAATAKLWRTDSEVLTVEGVAAYLHCSVAAARSIPENKLSRRSGPGRRVLYLKDDVIRYLRSTARTRPGIDDDMVRDVEAKVLGSKSDSGRRRSRKETGQ